MTIVDFLNRLDGAKTQGDGWIARCPAHDDGKPSLSIKEGDDGRILLKCFAGCEAANIASALSLQVSDLFVRRRASNNGRMIEATYDYRDEHGKLLFQTIRYIPKDFKQRRPDGADGWVYKLDGVRRVLYRLPELLAADPMEPVFLPEGEKHVDRLRAGGLVATCSPMGAGSAKNNFNWRPEYNESLRGRAVVILPDNDQPGSDHAHAKARALSSVAAAVKMLPLSGLPEKGDVLDWFGMGGTIETLRAMADAAPEWAPGVGSDSQSKGGVDLVLSRIVTAQTILETQYPEPKWAVKGIIPEGTTFIAGPPKLGKSILALNIAIAVAEDGKALSRFDVDPGSVLYLALEDGPRRIQERLRKLTDGRISDRLEVVTEWPRTNEGGLDAIEAWIESRKDARLLIVDTLKMLRPLGVSRNKNAYDADYEAIAPLTKIASQRVGLLIVHHSRKAAADDPLAEVSGSYGLTGAADGVLVLRRSRNKSDASLSVIGRDVEEQELALEFKPDMCLWSVLGKSEEVRRSSERQEVLDLLNETGELMAPKVIADLLDKQQTSTRTLLYKMRQTGEIKAFGNRYQLPDFEPPAKSVPNVPKAQKTGNASKSRETEDLPQNVPSVPSVPSNSQERLQDAETGTCDKVGTVGTFPDNSNADNRLGAFPVKNVPGNAGNASTSKPLADSLREMNDPTHQRRIVL